MQVSGLCEPGFEKLYEAFMLTFEKHKDNGAACALYGTCFYECYNTLSWHPNIAISSHSLLHTGNLY